MLPNHDKFMRLAIELSKQSGDGDAGGPFGAVIIKGSEVIATGTNNVVGTNNPTAHAEITAIEVACQKLSTYDLSDCILYTSCEPCPMCLGAIYWARIKTVYYANARDDAADIGFDDSYIYNEFARPMPERQVAFVQLAHDEARQVFRDWKAKPGRVSY